MRPIGHNLNELIAMGRAAFDDVKAQIIELLAQNGGSMGNYTLMRQLNCGEETYWKVHRMLVDEGTAVPWKGRGGSLKLTGAEAGTDETPNTQEEADEIEEEYSEASLYEPIMRVLKKDWVKLNRIEDYVIECTARQGRRETGGTWSRPDIVVAGVTTLKYYPGKILDLTTFEVKASHGINVTAVYEALAHLRAATRAYVIFHVPQAQKADKKIKERIDEIAEEASRHGIGLIIAEDVGDFSKWEILVEAEWSDTDPVRLNDFIAQQLSPEKKDQLERWCR